MAKKSTPAFSLGVPLQEKSQFLKVLLYGRQGTGKTTAAAAAAELGPVLVIDAEGGLRVRALSSLGIDTSQITAWPGDGSRITAQSLSELHEHLAANPEMFTTIVFDSITEIHHILRENATAQRVDQSRVVLDPDYVDRDDYNKMTTQLRRLIRLFRDLPCHIVFTALERYEDSGEIRPSLSPALGNDLMGYVDTVGRTAVFQGRHVARFEPTEAINAKDRDNALPPILANPTFTRLLAITSGTMDIETDPEQLEFLEAAKAANISPTPTPNTKK